MIKVCVSLDPLLATWWQETCETGLGDHITSQHAGVIQFLIDLTEYANVTVYSASNLAQVAIIDWALYSTSWITMHDLVEEVKCVKHVPEDTDVFASTTVADWVEQPQEPIASMIRKWQQGEYDDDKGIIRARYFSSLPVGNDGTSGREVLDESQEGGKHASGTEYTERAITDGSDSIVASPSTSSTTPYPNDVNGTSHQDIS